MLLGLLGGLALFLYGMQMMSNNLGSSCRKQDEADPEKLTTNRFMGILVGTGITALDPVIFSYNSYDRRLKTQVLCLLTRLCGSRVLYRYHHYRRTADRFGRRCFSTADHLLHLYWWFLLRTKSCSTSAALLPG